MNFQTMLSILIILIAAGIYFLIEQPDFIKHINNQVEVKEEEISEEWGTSPIVFNQDENREDEIQTPPENSADDENFNSSENFNTPVPSYNTQIKVNYPVELSYLTKKEVFDIRKKYVAQSIFANPNYEPSEEVFGQIIDNKPWLTVNICDEPNIESRIKGPSEEARFIVNPTVLVALEYPFYLTSNFNENWCNSDKTKMIPKSVSYSPENKEITVTYYGLPLIITNNSFYQFNGLNARDFGYNYLYIDKSKSTFDIPFNAQENPSTKVSSFTNYIHVGGSCGVSGGCNNGSPRQPWLEFTYRDRINQQNARIYIKLWKEFPSSPEAPADMNEIIVFEEI